jgi:hypothetical protein
MKVALSAVIVMAASAALASPRTFVRDEAGPLREIAPEIEQVVARIDALIEQLAA